MALTGEDPKKLIDRFGDSIISLYRECLRPQPPLRLIQLDREPEAQIAFGWSNNEVERALLDSPRFGKLDLYISHKVRAKKTDGGQYQLKSDRYSYKILHHGAGNSKALIRWEFGEDTFGNFHNPHVQFEKGSKIGPFSVDRLHIATGWVTFEAVLQFVFGELQVTAHREDWQERLRESRRLFRMWSAPIECKCPDSQA